MTLLSRLLALPEVLSARRRPAPALAAAVESVVDGTEPRIRAVGGYRRKLAGPVATAQAYIDTLVDRIPGPVEVSRQRYAADPLVNAFFAGPDELVTVFSRSAELRAFLDDPARAGLVEAHALLCLKREERSTVGMAVSGDMIRRDVSQTVVNFADHQVMSPGATEAEVRAGLRRCIFDGLITHALTRIVETKSRRRELEDERRILHARLRARQASGHGLTRMITAQVDDGGAAAERLAEAERRLRDLPGGLDGPGDYLDEVARVFGHPREFITLEQIDLNLTRMGVKVRPGASADARPIRLAEIAIPGVLRRVVAIARFPRDAMLAPAPERVAR